MTLKEIRLPSNRTRIYAKVALLRDTKFQGISYFLVGVYLLFAPKQFLPGCPIHSLFGIYCPACGATRAMRALLIGDFHRAAHENLLVITGPVFVFIGFWMQKRNVSKSINLAVLASVCTITLTFTILRNFSGSPLAPIL